MIISHWHRYKLLKALELIANHHSIDQQTLVEQSGKSFSAADLSRAKKGDLGEKRWNAIGSHIVRIADEEQGNEDVRQELRLLAKDLVSPPPDGELERAYVAQECLHSINAPLWQKAPKIVTTPLQGVLGPTTLASDALQSKLRDLLTRLHHEASPKSDGYNYLSFVADSDYSSVLSWTRCRSSPLLLLFPFFLTAERRMSWGVIPYAKHRCLGLLFPRHIWKPSSTTKSISPTEFLDHVTRQELTVHSLAGYVEEQIIFEMALQAGEQSLQTIERALTSSADASFAQVFQDLEHNHSCLLFGLERMRDIEDFVNQHGSGQDFRFATLHHELDVPTGIGFSFPALQWLQIEHRFTELKETANNLAWKEQDRFKSLGIEVLKPQSASTL